MDEPLEEKLSLVYMFETPGRTHTIFDGVLGKVFGQSPVEISLETTE